MSRAAKQADSSTFDPADDQWEREHAPRVSRGRWLFGACGYGLWVLFLAGMAFHRWILTLQ
jgi:hypothetical protein